jgi:hypothetical protein
MRNKRNTRKPSWGWEWGVQEGSGRRKRLLRHQTGVGWGVGHTAQTMNYITSISILLILVSVSVILVPRLMSAIRAPCLRIERRASALLTQNPNAEQTSVYLKLHSTFAWNKQREVDAKIAEMQPQGWTFLRIMEINPSRMIRYCGGGVTLQFIRAKV